MTTQLYVRIERDDKWENIEIDRLTDIELEIFAKQHPGVGWKWAKRLVKWIRDNVKEK